MSLTAGSLANVFCLDPVIEEETEYIPAPMHCCRECKGASGCTASLCPYPTPSLLTDNWWWDGVSITDTPRPAQGLINYFHLVIFLLVCFLLFLFLCSPSHPSLKVSVTTYWSIWRARHSQTVLLSAVTAPSQPPDFSLPSASLTWNLSYLPGMWRWAVAGVLATVTSSCHSSALGKYCLAVRAGSWVALYR